MRYALIWWMPKTSYGIWIQIDLLDHLTLINNLKYIYLLTHKPTEMKDNATTMQTQQHLHQTTFQLKQIKSNSVFRMASNLTLQKMRMWLGIRDFWLAAEHVKTIFSWSCIIMLLLLLDFMMNWCQWIYFQSIFIVMQATKNCVPAHNHLQERRKNEEEAEECWWGFYWIKKVFNHNIGKFISLEKRRGKWSFVFNHHLHHYWYHYSNALLISMSSV